MLALDDSRQHVLFTIPDALQCEIYSWITDSRTANAVGSTCRAGHLLRRDPTAAALLLLRQQRYMHSAGLAQVSLAWYSRHCHGGAAAVVQQLLRLVDGRPGHSGSGTHTIPAPMLQAALLSVVAGNDASGIRALLALPAPPDVHADNEAALGAALSSGANTDATWALLHAGASLCSEDHLNLFWPPTPSPCPLHPVQLLLLSLRGDKRAERRELRQALSAAMRCQCLKTFQWVSTQAENAGINLRDHLHSTTRDGSPLLLRALLDRLTPPLSADELGDCLHTAAYRGRPACVALLLSRGADVYYSGGAPLLCAIQEMAWRRAAPPPGDALLETIALLLRRGAAVTEAVRALAKGLLDYGGTVKALIQAAEAEHAGG